MPRPQRMSRIFWITFINMYKQYPCVWDGFSTDYNNQTLCDKVYADLVDLCRKNNLLVDKEYVVRKIKTFRYSFLREHKKVLFGHKPKASSNATYTPNLWCYDHLLFIVDPTKRGCSNLATNKAKVDDSSSTDTDSSEDEDKSKGKKNFTFMDVTTSDDSSSSEAPRKEPPPPLPPRMTPPSSKAPRMAPPHPMAPRMVPPQSMGPRMVPPQSMGPRMASSQSMGPRMASSQSTASRVVPPQSTAPRVVPASTATRMASPPAAIARNPEERKSVGDLNELVDLTINYLRNSQKHDDDAFVLAGKKVASDLSTVDPKQRVFVEKLIADAMFFAKQGKLCGTSRIQL